LCEAQGKVNGSHRDVAAAPPGEGKIAIWDPLFLSGCREVQLTAELPQATLDRAVDGAILQSKHHDELLDNAEQGDLASLSAQVLGDDQPALRLPR
jgi:hypothetical protein